MPSPTKELCWADFDSDDDYDYNDAPVVVPVNNAEKERVEKQRVEREEMAARMKEEAAAAQKKKRAEMWRREHEEVTSLHTAMQSTPSPNVARTPMTGHMPSPLAAAEYQPSSSLATPTPTRPTPRWKYKAEAQTKLFAFLSSKPEGVDVQGVAKALDWKKTYSRVLGSLYAFVKRDCKDTLVYDAKGNVRLRPSPAHPTSAYESTPPRSLDPNSPEFVPGEKDGAGSSDEAGTEEERPEEEEEEAEEQAVDPDVDDIAKSLLSMVW